MNRVNWATATEYSEVKHPTNPPADFDLEGRLEELSSRFSNENKAKPQHQQEVSHLGLHLQHDKPHASFYVGQVWLDQTNNIAARVRPRQDVDQFRMVNKCLKNPSAGKYLLKNGLYFFSEQPP